MENKIIQITATASSGLSDILLTDVYGLAADGAIYSLNQTKGEWEFIADSPKDKK